jgi:hypothetical protein
MLDNKANYFMTELNCSPQHLKLLIARVRDEYQEKHGTIPPDLQQVFDIAKKITPIPPRAKHGKMCVHIGCTFRMHCKSIRCPHCHHPQRKRKKQEPRVPTTTIQQQQQQQQPPPMQQQVGIEVHNVAISEINRLKQELAKRPRERVIEYQQPAPKKFKFGEKNWYTDGEHECDLCSGCKRRQRHSCAEDKDVPFYE